MSVNDSKFKYDMFNFVNEIVEYIRNEQPLVEDKLRPAVYAPANGLAQTVLVHVSRKPKFNGSFTCEFKDGSMKDINAYYLKFLDSQEYFNIALNELKLKMKNKENEENEDQSCSM